MLDLVHISWALDHTSPRRVHLLTCQLPLLLLVMGEQPQREGSKVDFTLSHLGDMNYLWLVAVWNKLVKYLAAHMLCFI
jgi:hypothetical protein